MVQVYETAAVFNSVTSSFGGLLGAFRYHTDNARLPFTYSANHL